MQNVSVVIVNYNAGAELQHCIAAITSDVDEIILVDNDSSDGSQHHLSEAFVKLSLLQNKQNIGFGAAVNQAVSTCKPENHILIINPDCQLHTGALKTLVNTLNTDKKIGLIAPLVFDGNGKEQSGSRRHLPTPWRLLKYACGLKRAIDLRSEPMPKAEYEYPAVSGACMLVRRNAWDTVGKMDQQFFLHFEDLDLMNSLRLVGFTIFIQPLAKATHTGGVSSSKKPLKVLWHKHYSLQKYLLKYYRSNILTWTLLPVINMVHFLLKGLLLRIRS